MEANCTDPVDDGTEEFETKVACVPSDATELLEAAEALATRPPCAPTRERTCLARLWRDDDTDSSELCARVGAGMPVGCRAVRTGSGPPGRRRAREKEAQGGAAEAAPTRPEDASKQRS